jgi:type IV pilus assembly protein PilO
MNQLSNELQAKTHQVEPLTDLPRKVDTANRQIADFYKKRFPAQDSQIPSQLGKLALANGVTIEQVKYKVDEAEIGRLEPIEMDANLSGNYVSLAKFVNALERDDMFFIINTITLAGEQNGPIKLQMKLETYLKAGT